MYIYIYMILILIYLYLYKIIIRVWMEDGGGNARNMFLLGDPVQLLKRFYLT